MNRAAATLLAKEIIGPVPPPLTSTMRGALSGVVLFFIFEYLSLINSNAPRVPVPWLLMVAVVIIESVLFSRIVRLLRQPRRNDLFFILRLDYAMRTTIARHATGQAHRAFIPFTGAILAVSTVLEFLFIHERSLIMLLVVPLAGLLVMVMTGFAYTTVITRHGIPCAHNDRIDDEAASGKGSFFRKQIAQVSVKAARSIAGMAPHDLRIVVMRNCLYLLRGEIVLSALIIIAAPAVLVPLLLLLNNPLSPFATLLPLIFIFMMYYHFASELGEAVEKLPECHWYRFTPGQLFRGYFLTLALPVAPLVVTALAVIIPAHLSLYGAVRLLNFCIAIAATLFIGCRSCMMTRNNDTDPVIAMTIFAVIAVGNFILWAGAFFSAAAAAIMVLLDWEILTGKK